VFARSLHERLSPLGLCALPEVTSDGNRAAVHVLTHRQCKQFDCAPISLSVLMCVCVLVIVSALRCAGWHTVPALTLLPTPCKDRHGCP
jgi:hypothetical protein